MVSSETPPFLLRNSLPPRQPIRSSLPAIAIGRAGVISHHYNLHINASLATFV